jgi:hypothetical protein
MAGLTIAPATGQQTATQDPQAATTQAVGAPAQSGDVQPGTINSLLTSTQGVSLSGTPLTTVNLTGSTQAQPDQASQPAHHHINYGLYGVSILLCVVAAVLFWATSRSAKNTTKR